MKWQDCFYPAKLNRSKYIYFNSICRCSYTIFSKSNNKGFCIFHNYMEVFKNAAFKLAAINTLKFVFICIPLLLIISLTIAVLMQRFIRNAYIIKTAFLIPMAVPIASIVLIWKIFFMKMEH